MPGGYRGNWTVSDYFDPGPGFERGLALRRQREAENQNRELAKQRALDKAAEDDYRRRHEMMQAAVLGERLGVDPVISPNGRPDPVATAQAGILKKATAEAAGALGMRHGQAVAMGIDEFPMTAEETKLTETPEYKRAYGAVMFEKMKNDMVKERMVAVQQERNRGVEVEVDEEGNPIPFEINGRQFFQPKKGSLREVTPPREGPVVQGRDESGKPIPGLFQTPDGKWHSVGRGNSIDDLFNDSAPGTSNGTPAAKGRKRFIYKDGKLVEAP